MGDIKQPVELYRAISCYTETLLAILWH